MNFLSIHRLVSIVDTANYSGVIRELNHANRLVTRYTVVCKESEKERRKHAALWGTSVKNNRFGERVFDLDRLRPVKKKVESPVTYGRMHIQRYKFIKQLHRNYGVKGRAKVLVRLKYWISKMVNSLRVNAGHGRDFHPLNDGKLSEVADKDLVCLERIVRI